MRVIIETSGAPGSQYAAGCLRAEIKKIAACPEVEIVTRAKPRSADEPKPLRYKLDVDTSALQAAIDKMKSLDDGAVENLAGIALRCRTTPSALQVSRTVGDVTIVSRVEIAG